MRPDTRDLRRAAGQTARHMKKLIVHIGAPKTGTSAIQSFMLRNRDALAGQGVLYPQSGMLKSAHHLIGAAIHPLRSKRLGSAPRDQVLATAIAGIRQEIALHSPETLVISSEYLWGKLSANNIQRLLSHFSDWSLNVVVYLRRQDLLAQSLYVQAVKTGSPLSFGEWADSAIDSGKGGFFFHDVLSCWRDCGLPVSVIVRIYEKSQIGSDVCTDFMQIVAPSLPTATLAADHRSVNSAPDVATTELLRVVNLTLKEKETAERIRRSIVKHSPPRALFAPLRYLGADEASEFMRRFEVDNEKVAREFAGCTDGVLFRDPPAEGAVDDTDFQSATLLDKLIGLLPALTHVPAAGNPQAAAAKPLDSDSERERRLKKKNKKKTGAMHQSV
jgi:hypothetical protein